MTKTTDFYGSFEATTGSQLSLRMEKVVSMANGFRFQSILDVGCGDGRFTKVFASACHCNNIVGIDVSKRLAKRANSLFPAFVATSDSGLPFRDEEFDGILCSELIEHLFDPDRLLTEIFRVLASDGVLFLTTPNLASWINRICLLLGFQPHYSEVSLRHNVGKLYGGIAAKTSDTAIGGHLRLFVPRSLDSLLRIYGFQVVERKGARIGYGGKSVLPFPISAVDRLFASRFSTSAFLIYVGRKRA